MSMDMNTNIEHQIGVHIDLPLALRRQITSLRSTLDVKYASHQSLPPHLTLHLARIRSSSFPQLLRALTGLHPKPFTVRLTSLRCDIEGDRLFFSQGVRMTPSLFALHQQIVRVTNTIRGNLVRSKDLERIKNSVYAKEQATFIRRYGYLRVLKNFRPHITVGSMQLPPAPVIQKRIRERVQQHAHALTSHNFVCDAFTVGLYLFDTTHGKFLRSPRDERIIQFSKK